MYSLFEIITGLKRGSAITIGGATIKRTNAFYIVTTKHGTRKLTDAAQVLAMAQGKLPCSKCGRNLAPDRFSMTAARGKSYRRSWCIDCEKTRLGAWYDANKHTKAFKARRAAYARQWRATNRERNNRYVRLSKIRRMLKLRGVA